MISKVLVDNKLVDLDLSQLIRSDEIDKVAVAIVVVQAEMGIAEYDANNPFHHNKYATLAAHWSAARNVLARNGLSFLQLPVGNGDAFGIMNLLLHESGQYLGTNCLVRPAKSAPQELMSLFTYLRRNSMSGALSIMSGEDDDGNAATFGTKHEPTEKELTDFAAKAKTMYDDGKTAWVVFGNLSKEFDWLTMNHVKDLWQKIKESEEDGNGEE